MASTYTIPLSALASQTLNVTLDGQLIRLDIYQRSTGLYMNIWLNDAQVVAGALCLNQVFIARYAYLGLPGDFVFIDTQGSDDPSYDGLGSRYILAYVSNS